MGMQSKWGIMKLSGQAGEWNNFDKLNTLAIEEQSFIKKIFHS